MMVALFCIITMCFMLIRILPMSPPEGMTVAQQDAILAQWEARGYNDPLLVQYATYLKGIVTEWDFGTSWKIKIFHCSGPTFSYHSY